MTLETAIRAMIGHDAADSDVEAVALQLAREGIREPMPSQIEAAARETGAGRFA